MTKPRESITLYGGRAERFREIKSEIEESLGYEPSNAESLGLIMSEWPESGDYLVQNR